MILYIKSFTFYKFFYSTFPAEGVLSMWKYHRQFSYRRKRSGVPSVKSVASNIKTKNKFFNKNAIISVYITNIQNCSNYVFTKFADKVNLSAADFLYSKKVVYFVTLYKNSILF